MYLGKACEGPVPLFMFAHPVITTSPTSIAIFTRRDSTNLSSYEQMPGILVQSPCVFDHQGLE